MSSIDDPGRSAFLESDRLSVPRVSPEGFTFGQRCAKRACDIIFSLVAILCLAPLLILTVVAIEFGDIGPVFVRRRRIGARGRTFLIYEFRTTAGNEDASRPTKLGEVLRFSGIYTLPQFINILKGDMSVVGPEPQSIEHDEQCATLVRDYALRRLVRPGMTGWAQINGVRGSSQTIEVIANRSRLDLWYIKNWSIFLDLRIIWRTCVETHRLR